MRYVISAEVNWVPTVSPTLRGSVSKLTTISMSVPASIPSPPRSTRPVAARKQLNDPAWFSNTTTSVTSVKRQAVERIEGEPRNKRKRVVEPTLLTTSQLGHRVDKPQERHNDEPPVVSVVLSCHGSLSTWAGVGWTHTAEQSRHRQITHLSTRDEKFVPYIHEI
jgi:hypothetical protein